MTTSFPVRFLFPMTALALALSACGGDDSSATGAGSSGGAPVLSFTDPSATYDLNNYTQTAEVRLPQGSGDNLLGDEASGIAFDTDTKKDLYIIGDGATAVLHTDLQGNVIDSMQLNPGDFQDTEGITYIGGGEFVLVEERLRQVNRFKYVPNGTLSRSQVQSIKTGTTVGNVGIEGVSFDAKTGGFFGVRQTQPMSIFEFTTDAGFTKATDSAGKPMDATTDNPTALFDASLTGLSDFNDVYALSNVLPATAPDADQILIVGAPDGKVEKLDRLGNIKSFLYMDPKGQNEGVTMGNDGTIYLAGEQASGPSIPGLTIFKPTTGPTNVGIGSNLFLTFANPAQAGQGKITLSNGSDTRTIDVTDHSQVTFNGNVAKIHPKYYLQANTTYSITYPANTFPGTAAVSDKTAFSFSTIGAVDTTAPAEESMAPANGAAGVSGSTDAITFNEAVQAGQGSIEIDGGSGSQSVDVNDTTQVQFSGPRMTLTLKTPFQPGSSYTVKIPQGAVTDLYGNSFAGLVQTFSTAAAGAAQPTLLITEVNSNALGPLPTDKAGKPSKQDFFELYNYGASPIDLTGWLWGDNHESATDPNNTATFPAGTVIKAGERIIVMPGTPGINDLAFGKSWHVDSNIQIFATVNLAGDLSNAIGLGGGDAVIVYDASGNVVTAVNYGGTDLTATQGNGTPFVIHPLHGGDPALLAAANHAGSVFPNGGDGHSAVWDGVSVSTPNYVPANVGDVLGSYAEPADPSGGSVGSPGK
jgi:uncharacterized protein YjiK